MQFCGHIKKLAEPQAAVHPSLFTCAEPRLSQGDISGILRGKPVTIAREMKLREAVLHDYSTCRRTTQSPMFSISTRARLHRLLRPGTLIGGSEGG